MEALSIAQTVKYSSTMKIKEKVIKKDMTKCKHNKLKDCTKCFEEKWGKHCIICGKRKGGVNASGSAEGGRNSTCKC